VDYPNQIPGKREVRFDVTDVKTHQKLNTYLGELNDGLQLTIHPIGKNGAYKITGLHAVTPEVKEALNGLLPDEHKQLSGDFHDDSLRMICEQLVKCEPFVAVHTKRGVRLHAPTRS
jgi:hypothetical protein